MSQKQRKSSFSLFKQNQTSAKEPISNNIDEIKEEYLSPLFPKNADLSPDFIMEEEIDPTERRLNKFFDQLEIKITDPRQKEFTYFFTKKQSIRTLKNQSTMETLNLSQKLEDSLSNNQLNLSKTPQLSSILIQKNIKRSSLMLKRNQQMDLLKQLNVQIQAQSVQESDSNEVKSELSALSLECKSDMNKNIASDNKNQLFFTFQKKNNDTKF